MYLISERLLITDCSLVV